MDSRFLVVNLGTAAGREQEQILFPTERLTGVVVFPELENGDMLIEVWDRESLIVKSKSIPASPVVPKTNTSLLGTLICAQGFAYNDHSASGIGEWDNKGDSQRILSIWNPGASVPRTAWIEVELG